MMARRMRRKSHVRCRAGEKVEIISNPYLLLYYRIPYKDCMYRMYGEDDARAWARMVIELAS